MIFWNIVAIILLINHFFFVNDFTEVGPGLALIVLIASIIAEVTVKIGKRICDLLVK